MWPSRSRASGSSRRRSRLSAPKKFKPSSPDTSPPSYVSPSTYLFHPTPDSKVTELGCGNVRYSEAVRQLEGLLELERETLSVKRKVAGFTVDYDDDLVINVEY